MSTHDLVVKLKNGEITREEYAQKVNAHCKETFQKIRRKRLNK